MKFIIRFSLILFLGLAFTVISQTGCEDVKGIDGIMVRGPNGSNSVTLALSEKEVLLTATFSKTNNLAFPLEWRVSDPSLGTIVNQSSATALYRRAARTGSNIITVTDQYDNEGFATIVQQ